MKKLLIAAASLVALNTAALADPEPSYDFSGATNIGEITQGNGINAAFLTQFAAQDVDDIDIDDDAFLGDLEEVQEFQDQCKPVGRWR
jgi:hypothetical protein